MKTYSKPIYSFTTPRFYILVIPANRAYIQFKNVAQSKTCLNLNDRIITRSKIENLFILNLSIRHACLNPPIYDRAERHYLKSRFFLVILLFFFPLFFKGREKGKRMNKVVILSHAFLLDPFIYLSYRECSMSYEIM